MAIGEIGYVFLFRNYRADQGKWQTMDPMGYPDGWNNLAYVNNTPGSCIDALGLCRTETIWDVTWEGENQVLSNPVDITVHDTIGTLTDYQLVNCGFWCTIGGFIFLQATYLDQEFQWVFHIAKV